MECPKCQHQQPDTNTECIRCGLIFNRYRLNPRPASEKKAEPTESLFRRVLDYILFIKPEGSRIALHFRIALLLFLFMWSWWFILTPIESNYAGRSFMHLVNLPFHEAGHVLTRFFGAFICSLSGSLGQLLMPLICMGVLMIKTRDNFGASVALWWLGESFIDLAPYINDARSLTLPLLGGNTGHSSPFGFHDWQFILVKAGLIRHDHLIAGLAKTVGSIFMIAALAWGGTILYRQFRRIGG